MVASLLLLYCNYDVHLIIKSVHLLELYKIYWLAMYNCWANVVSIGQIINEINVKKKNNLFLVGKKKHLLNCLDTGLTESL